jgi:hypothetical protein
MHDAITAHPKTALIAEFLPTQITVGMREVSFKRNRWREKDREAAAISILMPFLSFLAPKPVFFIVDRHHLLRALHDEGLTEAPISVVEDWSNLPHDVFWSALQSRNWCRPFDDKGERRDYRDIPKSLGDLIDDPFRSLAGALKRGGGYTKDKSLFSEFRWADFLRDRIERETIENDFDCALALAMSLARSYQARALPGWLGSVSD